MPERQVSRVVYQSLKQWFEASDLRSISKGSVAVKEWYDGRYQVEAVLGAGQTSVVFRAIDTSLERNVALKFWHGWDHELDSAMLLRETRLLAKVQHPKVVKVFDYGVDDAMLKPWAALEYLGGATLRDLIKGGRSLPLSNVLNIGKQLAEIVRYLHHLCHWTSLKNSC